MRRRSRSSQDSWLKPTATPVACCPPLDNASAAGDLIGEQGAFFRTSQSTDRIDRTARKVLISRDFVRAVLSRGVDRQWTVTERHGTYRPRIAHLGMWSFAGLSPYMRCPRSVRSIR